MADITNAAGASMNSTNWPLSPVLSTPLLAVLADINGKLLESAATAHKDWAEFVHRRVKEDIAASQRLMSCRSLGDMRQVYSEYMRTALEHYRDKSEKGVQRGKSTTEGLAKTIAPGAGQREM